MIKRSTKFLAVAILMMCSQIAVCQEFEFHLNELDLEKSENGFYIDTYGTCYELTLTLNAYELQIDIRNKYSVQVAEIETENFPNFVLKIANEKSVWEKRKADKNCLSQNPDDCMVWCKVQIPRRVVDIEILDESATIGIENLDEDYWQLLLESGFAIFSELKCEIDEQLEIEIQSALQLFFEKSVYKDQDLMDLVQLYQLQQELPIGGFNLETLYKLGID